MGEKVLYGLYGIVEHSGSMRGGHYTAYVKVRVPSRKLSECITGRKTAPGMPPQDIALRKSKIDSESLEKELQMEYFIHLLNYSSRILISQSNILLGNMN